VRALQSILSLSGLELFLALLTFVLLSAAIALVLMIVLWRWTGGPLRLIPVPTFLGVVATAWALSLGFAASDVWSLAAQADKAAAAERSAVMRLAGIAEPGALDVPALYEAMVAYVDRVEASEWGEARNGEADPGVDAILQTVRLAIIDMARSGLPTPLVNKTVNDFDELQDARNDRLAIGQSLVDEAKWYLVLSLSIMSMVTIAVGHIDRPRAGANAMAIYSVVVMASLWVLALHINPYQHMDVPFTITSAAAF
jgi:hypothetical protein